MEDQENLYSTLVDYVTLKPTYAKRGMLVLDSLGSEFVSKGFTEKHVVKPLKKQGFKLNNDVTFQEFNNFKINPKASCELHIYSTRLFDSVLNDDSRRINKWDTIFKDCENCYRVVSFSHVYYNAKTRTYAVYIAYTNGSCATGLIAYLKKQKGKWSVIKTKIIFV
mgnify:CR=1 FL=1